MTRSLGALLVASVAAACAPFAAPPAEPRAAVSIAGDETDIRVESVLVGGAAEDCVVTPLVADARSPRADDLIDVPGGFRLLRGVPGDADAASRFIAAVGNRGSERLGREWIERSRAALPRRADPGGGRR